jgi:uncharacterized membrane protein
MVKRAYQKKEAAFFSEAALVIILVCFFFEVFVFNARHFVTHWGDDQIDMGNTKYELINIACDEQTGLYIPRGRAEIVFTNINKRVVTVYIDALFSDYYENKTQLFQINYGDEKHSNRTTASFNVIRGINETKYVILQTSGKVSYIRLIIYANEDPMVAIRGVTLNKPVPLKIFWPRMLLFSTITFCIVVIKYKKLFSLPLKSSSWRQNILTASIVLAFIAYLFTLMLLTAPFSFDWPFKENFAYEPIDQYNAEIVDAILDGHAYLNIEPSEEFLALKNPYDKGEREAAHVYPPWDYAYYNGKFYSYFGIVQVLVLSLPYKLITGRYIPTRVAVFIFSALTSVFLMLIWRCLAFRYMKNMPLGMYALGQLAVAMCSMVTFLVIIQRFYENAVTAALFFTTLGIWVILSSTKHERINIVLLALGCLCMALAVGCRPNYMFFLPLIPVLLIKHLKEAWSNKKQFFKLCVYATAPCILVACGLMWWNYIRFGSVLEFGMNYMIGGHNVKGSNLLNPLGKTFRAFTIFFCFLIPSFRITASFPFVYLKTVADAFEFRGIIFVTPVMGLLALPAIWSLPGVGILRKNIDEQTQPVFHLCIAMICLGFFQIMFISSGIAVVTRYTADFFWLFIFSGLISSYLLWNSTKKACLYSAKLLKKTYINLPDLIQRLVCIGIMISVMLVFLSTFGGGESGSRIMYQNLDFVYSIQRLLGFNTW